MKLTKGKIKKLYNKKVQTRRKYKKKINSINSINTKTFRKKRHLNLSNKTLKMRGGTYTNNYLNNFNSFGNSVGDSFRNSVNSGIENTQKFVSEVRGKSNSNNSTIDNSRNTPPQDTNSYTSSSGNPNVQLRDELNKPQNLNSYTSSSTNLLGQKKESNTPNQENPKSFLTTFKGITNKGIDFTISIIPDNYKQVKDLLGELRESVNNIKSEDVQKTQQKVEEIKSQIKDYIKQHNIEGRTQQLINTAIDKITKNTKTITDNKGNIIGNIQGSDLGSKLIDFKNKIINKAPSITAPNTAPNISSNTAPNISSNTAPNTPSNTAPNTPSNTAPNTP